MSARWIRTAPGTRDTLAAAAVAGVVAVGVGVAAFWLTRLFLSRERLPGDEASRSGARPADGRGGTA